MELFPVRFPPFFPLVFLVFLTPLTVKLSHQPYTSIHAPMHDCSLSFSSCSLFRSSSPALVCLSVWSAHPRSSHYAFALSLSFFSPLFPFIFFSLGRFEVEHLFNCGKLRATRIETFRALSGPPGGSGSGRQSYSDAPDSQLSRKSDKSRKVRIGRCFLCLRRACIFLDFT
jgi:hypothetical protein